MAALAAVAVATACDENPEQPDNNTTVEPVEHEFLGFVSFKTDKTWTVGGLTWSDAVTATRCQKDDYNGGVYGGEVYKIDCRKNEFPGDDYNEPQVFGDYFSWEAVNAYGDVLCPEPWRTPTQQDFKDLDIALGGDGKNNEMLAGRIQLYVDEWGGEFGGYVWFGKPDSSYPTDTMICQNQADYACYWSGQSLSKSNAAALAFGTPKGYLSPAAQAEKTNGYTLRCVK